MSIELHLQMRTGGSSGGGLQPASEVKASEDIVSISSDENSNSGSSDASRRGSTKESSDVDMS